MKYFLLLLKNMEILEINGYVSELEIKCYDRRSNFKSIIKMKRNKEKNERVNYLSQRRIFLLLLLYGNEIF